MRGSLYAGGFQVIRVGDPREEQDAVNLRALEASAASFLQTFREYHDLYMKSDVLLLTDVFESFRSVCLKNYGLSRIGLGCM